MRKKKLYVVGYDHDDGSIYGGEETATYPLTETEAKKMVKQCSNGSVIYKLVSVKPEDL